METIFSKIIAREIPADIVYEDEQVLAFLDINPSNKGHALVIPKKPFTNIFDGDAGVLGHMMRVAQKIARALQESVGAEGVNIIMNNEAVAGQEVMHAHLHVIPRYIDDNVFQPAQHTTYEEGESAEVAAKIKSSL